MKSSNDLPKKPPQLSRTPRSGQTVAGTRSKQGSRQRASREEGFLVTLRDFLLAPLFRVYLALWVKAHRSRSSKE
jgi:hypothetical protein